MAETIHIFPPCAVLTITSLDKFSYTHSSAFSHIIMQFCPGSRKLNYFVVAFVVTELFFSVHVDLLLLTFHLFLYFTSFLRMFFQEQAWFAKKNSELVLTRTQHNVSKGQACSSLKDRLSGLQRSKTVFLLDIFWRHGRHREQYCYQKLYFWKLRYIRKYLCNRTIGERSDDTHGCQPINELPWSKYG